MLGLEPNVNDFAKMVDEFERAMKGKYDMVLTRPYHFLFFATILCVRKHAF